MEKVTFMLQKKAKRFGGDKYADHTGNFVIYIPQTISRDNLKRDESFEVIKASFEAKE